MGRDIQAGITMTKFANALRRDEAGTAAIEYGLIAMLIAVALVGTFLSLGNEVETQYEEVGTQYADAANV